MMYKKHKFMKVKYLLNFKKKKKQTLFYNLVSNLTRRLLIVENEKTESDHTLETIRIKNDDLKRKYEQIMIDNNHRIHIQEHVQEISEMKRLTGQFVFFSINFFYFIFLDELSEKHANEMHTLLRRVQVN